MQKVLRESPLKEETKRAAAREKAWEWEKSQAKLQLSQEMLATSRSFCRYIFNGRNVLGYLQGVSPEWGWEMGQRQRLRSRRQRRQRQRLRLHLLSLSLSGSNPRRSPPNPQPNCLHIMYLPRFPSAGKTFAPELLHFFFVRGVYFLKVYFWQSFMCLAGSREQDKTGHCSRRPKREPPAQRKWQNNVIWGP